MATFLIGIVAAIGAGAGPVGNLTVLSAFEYPSGVCRVIVRNDGAGTIDLSEIEVIHGQEARLPLVWVVSEPPQVPPGGLAYVTYRFDQGWNAAENGLDHCLLGGDGVRCPYPAPGTPPLAVTYLVFDANPGRVYLYLRNPGPEARRVIGTTVGGQALELETPVDIEAGSVNLVLGQWEDRNPADNSIPFCCIDIDVSGTGSVRLPARLFRPDHAPKMSMESLSPLFAFRCASHRHGPPREAGRAAVASLLAASGSARAQAFCNVDMVADAQDLFAPLFERCRIEPQPAFSNQCWAGNHVKPTLDSARRTKAYVEPGSFYPVLFAEYIHRDGTPPFGLSAIRDVAYACLAAGAKGATLGDTHSAELTQESSRALRCLSREVDRLHPLISIAEPVPWATVNDDAWCTAHLLLCGDRGFLLILLPRMGNRERQDATVSLRVRDGRWEPATRAEEVGGFHESVGVDEDEACSRVVVERSDQTRVFFVPFLGGFGVEG
ncbi:MAG: hypothetical protein GY851_20550 [bacterium]|nr:hypothetical protein [bacterium]